MTIASCKKAYSKAVARADKERASCLIRAHKALQAKAIKRNKIYLPSAANAKLISGSRKRAAARKALREKRQNMKRTALAKKQSRKAAVSLFRQLAGSSGAAY